MVKSVNDESRASLYSMLAVSAIAAHGAVLLSRLLLVSFPSFASSEKAGARECTEADYKMNVFLPFDVTHALSNSSCLLRFATPDFATPADGTFRLSRTNFPMHRLVALIGRPQHDGSDLCGFCRARQSDWDEDPEWASIMKAPLVVRRCENQRSATSSFNPYSRVAAAAATAGLTNVNRSWNAVMAWSRAPVTVRFDGSCASNDLYFVDTYEHSWNICRQMANGSSVAFYPVAHGYRRIEYFTIFAQDRELSSWLPMPDEYACSDEKDYELVFSGARGGENVEIDIHMGPSNDSCRMLCVAEQCDFDYRSDNRMDIKVKVNRPLKVQYRLRSANLLCEPKADTGFALRFGFRDAWQVVIVTTHERDSLLRAPLQIDAHKFFEDKQRSTLPATNVPQLDPLDIGREPVEIGRIASIASGCVVATGVLVTALVFIARCRARCVQKKLMPDFTIAKTKLLTNSNCGKNHLKAGKAILEYGNSTVSGTGNSSLSKAAARRSTTGASSYAKQAEQHLSTSEVYAEIEDVKPLSNMVQRTVDGSIGLRFLPDGRAQCFDDNAKLVDCPPTAVSASWFLSPGTGLPDNSLDEPVYCELDVPDAHYTFPTTGNDNSQYSGLL